MFNRSFLEVKTSFDLNITVKDDVALEYGVK
jgi:hypothetical protein